MNRERFINMDVRPKSKVKLGDGSFQKVEGKRNTESSQNKDITSMFN